MVDRIPLREQNKRLLRRPRTRWKDEVEEITQVMEE
jgi:hypothetical protein